MRTLLTLLACGLTFLSCTDGGEEPLHIVSVDPAPNAIDVDKAQFITVRVDRPVPISQAGKIRVNYLNDTTSLKLTTTSGLTPPEGEFLSTGPFIWMPGKTVEVFIPMDISDSHGRSLLGPFSYRFTIADDAPFQVVDSEPQAGDTVSIRGDSTLLGHVTFSDYLPAPDSLLTIIPSGEIIVPAVVVVDGRNLPSRVVSFLRKHLEPDVSYTIVVPGGVKDYEGEELMADYQVEFRTRP